MSLVSSLIGAGGSLIGGIMQAHAADKASKLQAASANRVAGMATDAANKAGTGAVTAGNAAAGDVNAATDQANQTLGSTLQAQTGNLNPYLQAGQQGVTSLSQMLQPGGDLSKQFSFDGSGIEDDPGYKFRMEQGQQALERSAAATGQLQGGGTLKAITQYGQGLASTEFGNAYDRALKTFQTNRQGTLSTLSGLTSLAGLGLGASGQFNQAEENAGNQQAGYTLGAGRYAGDTGVRTAEYAGNAGLQGAQIAGNALTGGANAQAAGAIGRGNAFSGALGGVANAVQGYSLGQMLNPGGYGSGSSYGVPPIDHQMATQGSGGF